MKKKKIKIPIYFGSLIIIKVDNITDANKKYSINANESYESFCFTTENKKGSKKYYIVLKKETDISIIAHEVVHLVNYIFLHNGIELDRHNDEPQAYLTGWIFKQINKFYLSNN